MSFYAVSLVLPAKFADRYADALLERGALSVAVEDAALGTGAESPLFAEPGASGEVGAAWPSQRLEALFHDAVDVQEAMRAAAHDTGIGPLPAIDVVRVADQDWVRLTQSQFAPIRVAPRLWIVPTWCEPVDPAAVNLRLDPGLAFGTGSHPTTRMCLRWLVARLRPGDSVLDYGCGSGILAIAAARLGAGRVLGVDIDPEALRTGRGNAGRNAAEVQFVLPGDDGQDSFDLVLANILANPLEALAPLLAARTRPGGRLVIAGLLDVQADALAGVYAPWFNMVRFDSEEGWTALEGERLRAR
jgi:ribosomal protein L11 methyltransferase